ncbi:hypothetical protein D9Q98_002547 [Chlorella vulgaris]|uniref:RING-type E3 ubiquitin transferase n=1 Tax=Chlorella vulgaris TaxID=3077 RepID=A0A9D4YZT7_CHLVU|nr:hypothetical protein D9Q98_002547 [Chlorella vulgaris]
MAAALQRLEAIVAAAACPICGAPIETPLILGTCGHSFCSSCIRQSLRFQELERGRACCPSCRAPCDSSNLLSNTTLREVMPLLHTALEAARQQAAVPDTATRRRHTRSVAAKAQVQGNHGTVAAGKDLLTAASGSCDASTEQAGASSTIGDSSSSHGDASLTTGSSQSPPRQPRQRKRARCQGGEPAAAAAKAAAPDVPTGFVACPVCSRSVPRFYILEHVDSCLASGGATEQPTAGGSNSRLGSAARPAAPSAAAAAAGSVFKPLAVPAKLVPSLTSEKALRAACKRYGLPLEGRKKDLLERYNTLRLLVEVANDKQEGITYERLAKRVVQQQRQDAASKMLSGGCRQSAAHAQGSAQLQAAGVKLGGTQHAQGACAAPPGADEPLNAGEVPFGASYAQLVAATRSRDAARRAQRVASAAAEPAPRAASAAPAEPVQLPPSGEEEEGQAAEAVAATAADPSPAASWDDGSEALWGDELPLSQVQEPV